MPAEWLAQSAEAGQHFNEACGLLWWREGKFALELSQPVLDMWRDLRVPPAALAAGAPLVGRGFPDKDAYVTALKSAMGADAVKQITDASDHGDHIPLWAVIGDGPIVGVSARGWLGQLLVVLPKAHLVAVRMREAVPSDYGEQGEKNGYPAFSEDVAKLF